MFCLCPSPQQHIIAPSSWNLSFQIHTLHLFKGWETGGKQELLPVLDVQGDAAGKEAGGKLIPDSRVEEGEVKMMNLGEHVQA